MVFIRFLCSENFTVTPDQPNQNIFAGFLPMGRSERKSGGRSWGKSGERSRGRSGGGSAVTVLARLPDIFKYILKSIFQSHWSPKYMKCS